MSSRNEPEVATVRFENVSKELNKGAQATGEAIKNVGNAAKQDIQKTISNGKEQLEKGAQKLTEEVSETYDALREEGKAYLHQGTSALQNIQSRSEDYIQNHPFKSIFIAFGIGAGCALVGIFKCTFSRRSN